MFSKSSVFAVVALAAFACLGVLLLPQVVQAQVCVWDCDLGSDPSFNPWGNSPQSQLDIAFCIDQGCVFQNLIPTLGPIPSTSTDVALVVSDPPPQTCTNPLPVGGAYKNVSISGPVVAWLRDALGNIVPGSPAQAQLSLTIKCATQVGTAGSGSSTITRAVTPKEPRTNVFDGASNIKIFGQTIPTSPNTPSGWTGCNTFPCAFALGIVEFNNNNAIAAVLPAFPGNPPLPYLQGEVFRADEATRFVGVRDCKGTADTTPASIDPTTIQCSSGSGGNQSVSVGGGQSLALLFFLGNYSGATSHTINPTKGSNPYDISLSTAPSVIVLPGTVLASASTSTQSGSPIKPTGCNAIPSQQVERCFFVARDFNITCTNGEPVTVLVTGLLQDGRKFESIDPQLVCSNNNK
jgi:hypothetical protein